MRKYIEIQNELIDDFNMNVSEFNIELKNSVKSTYNLCFLIGLHITNKEEDAKEFAENLMKKYDLMYL